MLITKNMNNIQNNTLYTVQELCSSSFSVELFSTSFVSWIFSIHSSTSLSTIFFSARTIFIFHIISIFNFQIIKKLVRKNQFQINNANQLNYAGTWCVYYAWTANSNVPVFLHFIERLDFWIRGLFDHFSSDL